MDNPESFNSEPSVETITPPPLPTNTETPPPLPSMGNEVQAQVIEKTPEQEQNNAVMETLAEKYPDAFTITKDTNGNLEKIESKSNVLKGDLLQFTRGSIDHFTPERKALVQENYNLLQKVGEIKRSNTFGAGSASGIFESMLTGGAGVRISEQGIESFGPFTSLHFNAGTLNELGDDDHRKERIELFAKIVEHLDKYNKMAQGEVQTTQTEVNQTTQVEEKPKGFSAEELRNML